MLQLYFFVLRTILDDVMLSVFVHCYLTRRCGGQTGMEKVGLISWISCWWDWRECHCFVVTLGNKVNRTCKEENQFENLSFSWCLTLYFCSRNLLGIDADSVKSPLSVSSELGFSDLGLRLLFLTFDLTAVFLEIFSWTAQLPSLRRQRSSGFTFLVTLSSFFVFVVTTWNNCHRLKFIQHSTIWKQTKHSTQFSRELSWLGVTYWLSSTVFPRLC